MAHAYGELLEATIAFLEGLKSQGEKWIQLDPACLAGFTVPAARRRPTEPRPAPKARPVAKAAEPAALAPQQEDVLRPAPIAPPEPTVAPVNKVARIAELRARALVCQKCPHLAESRKNVVFGVGDIDAPLMFVGEAPGADEDAQGEPFVGAAGQLLTRIIKAMGYTRETVYIANILKCRPNTPGKTSGNRKPSAEEMQTCLPYLLEQIELIRPKVIVALGATAMEGLFAKPVAITRARGHWQTFNGTPVMPTFHPSYLLRNQAPAVKREVWEDMLQVLEKLGVPISDKQRSFFKPATNS
jgi:uracil-DNA glycosylase family 4